MYIIESYHSAGAMQNVKSKNYEICIRFELTFYALQSFGWN